MLQQLPTPVEVGQSVIAGTALGKVAQPSKLKAELKIAETQVKDVRIGQNAEVDTRNGKIPGPGFAHRSFDFERDGHGGCGVDHRARKACRTGRGRI
jgi:hypothetical protein